MACCCKPPRANKASVSCLGRCDLPKHRCLNKEDVKSGPVPKHMGWHYTAKNAPEHQLRCGWRPGHISCSVLKKIERHNCMKSGECMSCGTCCTRSSCSKPCCLPPKCIPVCPSSNSCCKQPVCGQPLIRVIRHGGQYSICTKPSKMSNAPSGPFPLKYVLNTAENETEDKSGTKAKYCVEAKFNDYHFDYTSSQASFVLDFSPPNQKCYKMCPKKSASCMLCES
ncbi:keratin-associated protein 5-1-like [Battus philenor]|uniref:keratin-associated protein 5-1-like n=1 Tax=Battus philenor TaxID=42288 RepID=UPI0035CF52E0